MKKILLVSTCAERLHELEFVKPVEEILTRGKINFFTRHYLRINKKDLENATHVILCGTSLQDSRYLKDIRLFEWVRDFKKPILGICAGMQVLGLIFGGVLKQKKEIGFYFETFKNSFLGLKGRVEVWHLHNQHVNFNEEVWEVSCEGNGIQQAIKHKARRIYGVLFHPEVRQKELIKRFVEDE